MAADTILLRKRAKFGAKAESTTGTEASTSATEAAYFAYNVEVRNDTELNQREREDTWGTHKGKVGALAASVKGSFELMGTGAGGCTWDDDILAAAGFSGVGGVWTPAVADAYSVTTATVAHWQAGRKKVAYGCAFNLNFVFEAGKIAMCEFDGRGIWKPPAAEAVPEVTYPTLSPLICKSMTITAATTEYRVAKAAVNMNATVTLRQDASASSGFRSACVTNIVPTITIDPEALPLATKDWFDAFASETAVAIVITAGSATGNMLTISTDTAQLRNSPEDQDREGVLVDALTFQVDDNDITLTIS